MLYRTLSRLCILNSLRIYFRSLRNLLYVIQLPSLVFDPFALFVFRRYCAPFYCLYPAERGAWLSAFKPVGRVFRTR
jgi:hypothetical protein